jgi:hypothetical protein
MLSKEKFMGRKQSVITSCLIASHPVPLVDNDHVPVASDKDSCESSSSFFARISNSSEIILSVGGGVDKMHAA